jgi:hypothetical protein
LFVGDTFDVVPGINIVWKYIERFVWKWIYFKNDFESDEK